MASTSNANGPATVANVPGTQPYDKFPMKSAPIYPPAYDTNKQIPDYKVPDYVVRPKSSNKGRSPKGNYGSIKPYSYPDFYPIYGPQGEHQARRYPDQPGQRNGPEAGTSPREERPSQESKRDPKKYYNNTPDTRDRRYSNEEPRRKQERLKEQKISPMEDKKRQKDVANEEEKYIPNKNNETPAKVSERYDPVIADPYQSKLKNQTPEEKNETQRRQEDPKQDRQKKVEEPKASTSAPMQEERENVRNTDYGLQERPRKKPRESPEVRNKEDPIYKDLYQSKLKQNREEPYNRQAPVKQKPVEEKDEVNEDKKAERQEPYKRQEPVKKEPVEEKQEENEEEKAEREEPYKRQEPVKQKLEEEKHEVKEEKTIEREKVQNKDSREPDGRIRKKPRESPETRNQTEDPIYRDLYQSKLKQNRDELQKKQEPLKQKPVEEKREEKLENEQKKPEEEIVPEKEQEPPLRHKDGESPETVSDKTQPVIRDLYTSKLKKEEPIVKKQEHVKPIPKEDEKKQVKDVPKEENESVHEEENVLTDRDREHPEKKRDNQQAILREPYTSKLREKVDDPNKKRREEAKPVQKEEKESDLEEDKENLTDRDREHPEKKRHNEQAIIREPYTSKLREKVDDPNKKRREQEKKKEPKKEEPVAEEKKKEPLKEIKKNEPEKEDQEEKRKDDDDDKNEYHEENPQAEPDPYDYRPVEKVRKEEARRVDKKPVKPQEDKPNDDSRKQERKKPRMKETEEPERKIKPRPKREVREEEDDKRRRVRLRYIEGRGNPTVRAKHYETVGLDEVLLDKITSIVRANGVSETRVVPLSAKITQAVRDDVIDAHHQASPKVTANLKEAVNKHLDPMLFNKADVTDLRDAYKPSDAKKLSNLVLMRIAQVHEEADMCKKSVDELKPHRGKDATPRDNTQDRSVIMAINDGIKKLKTDNDILRDKLKKAKKQSPQVTDVQDQNYDQLQNMDSENWKLEQELNKLEREKHSLLAKLKSQQKDYNRLDKQHQQLRQDNALLILKVNDTEAQSQYLSNDLLKLQAEKGRLQVLLNQRDKEIVHLRGPDQDMAHQIDLLKKEGTLLRTQTRRLGEEKGMLKSRSQKLEASLEDSYNQKNKLAAEKEKLLEENEDLKQRYRKLALASPQQRLLPDINSGRNGPSSLSPSRSNSRAPSRNIRSHDDRRMSPAPEEDESTPR